MQIKDARGRTIDEVILTLSDEELVDLLVATSELEDKSSDHALLRSPGGASLAVYREQNGPTPLERGSDWWMGPVVLVAVLLLVVGAYTIARGAMSLLF